MGYVNSAPPAIKKIVGSKAGQVPWAREAVGVLRETASHYGATITYPELAAEVQRRSGVHTSSESRTWLGGVLRLVATACQGRDLPPLLSLAVNPRDGHVAPVYDAVRQSEGLPPFETKSDRERHAAESRLACYRAFCDAVPEEARPMSARSKTPAATTTRRKPEPVELRAPVCPSCFIELPLMGGDCPNCN